MGWICNNCGYERNTGDAWNKCPLCGKADWRIADTSRDIAKKQLEELKKQQKLQEKQIELQKQEQDRLSYSSNTSSYSSSSSSNLSFSLFGNKDSDDDCKYSIAQNIILLIEIVVGLIAGYIVRIDADISWNLLVYIGLQVTAVVMGKHDELNVFKRLVGSVCLYIFEAVVAQMCLSGGPFSFVIMLIVGVAPYFIHVAIPNIKEGNSIFGED